MHITKLIISILAVALGTFAIVFGGYDDSPGAQLIGVLIVVSGIIGIFKARKKSS